MLCVRPALNTFFMMTIEENRRKVFRTNLLLSLFFCVMLIGVIGAVYYYQESKEAKTLVQLKNDSLSRMGTTLDSINQSLLSSKRELEKQKASTDSLIRLSIKDANPAILRPVINRVDNSMKLAAEYELKGYGRLKAGDLIAAKDYFNKSEKAYNGYHQVYEIWFLLYKNRDKLNDPETKQRLLNQVKKDYSRFVTIEQGITD